MWHQSLLSNTEVDALGPTSFPPPPCIAFHTFDVPLDSLAVQ